jgi:hypothetical protein
MTPLFSIVVGMTLVVPQLDSRVDRGKPITVRLNPYVLVIEAGQQEPASVGSYSVRVFNDEPELYGDFVDGEILRRDGSIVETWIANLDHSQTARHLLVWTQSAGSGSFGKVDVFRVDGMGKLRREAIPELPTVQGYAGHDRYFTTNGALFREFPVGEGGTVKEFASAPRIRFVLDLKSSLWVRVGKCD